MNAKWFDKNGVTGTREVAPAGHYVYTVTHAASGRTMTTDVSSLALRIAREWAKQAPAVELMTSPLPAAERCASGLARGATLTTPNEAQAARMREAVQFRDGVIPRYGHTYGVGLSMLRALARRGWVELNHSIRPTYGTLTDNGRRALVRYEASKAGAR